MAILTEVLPATKSSPHNAVRWSPAEADYSPVCGVIQIQTKRDCAEYLVTEFPTPWRGRGFHLDKLAGGTDAESGGYDVFCSANGPEADSCDCKGATYSRTGTCKHLAGIRALLANGWL